MILMLRHGERKNQSKDIKEKESWIKSIRFKTNPFDIPLSKNGVQMCLSSIENILSNYSGEFGYIYSSGYTRCVQTSLQFQKFIESEYKIKIPIRIEYGLVPNFEGYVDSIYTGFIINQFETNCVVKFSNNKVKIIKPIQYIDDYLFEENIYKRYGKKHFDTEYKPFYTIKQINSDFSSTPQDICSNRIDTLVKLSKLIYGDNINNNNNSKLNLIVTHGEIISLIYAWINNVWNPNKGFDLCGGLELSLTKKKNPFKIIKEIKGISI